MYLLPGVSNVGFETILKWILNKRTLGNLIINYFLDLTTMRITILCQLKPWLKQLTCIWQNISPYGQQFNKAGSAPKGVINSPIARSFKASDVNK